MAIGTFTGYAVPAQLASAVDHTYVVLTPGVACGCFGRSSGGQPICSGQGNVDQGACLSTPAGTAGIAYGLEGVCHQMANRILWPAGLTVLKARGARGSMFTWGMYGRDPIRSFSPASYPWPELATCLASHAHP